jgi:hypothetical protein
MTSARRFTAAAATVLAALALATTAAMASSQGSGFFRSPTGNIYCLWVTGGSTKPAVECGIKTGLKPKPKNTCKHIDYVGNRIDVQSTGKAKLAICAGDAGPFADPKATKVLPYGKSVTHGGITCASKATGMTCTNKSKHGFFMSKQSYKLF